MSSAWTAQPCAAATLATLPSGQPCPVAVSESRLTLAGHGERLGSITVRAVYSGPRPVVQRKRQLERGLELEHLFREMVQHRQHELERVATTVSRGQSPVDSLAPPGPGASSANTDTAFPSRMPVLGLPFLTHIARRSLVSLAIRYKREREDGRLRPDVVDPLAQRFDGERHIRQQRLVRP